MASQPPAVVQISDWSGGVNTSLESTRIKENESVLMQNAEASDDGTFTQRKGFVQIADTLPEDVSSMGNFSSDAGVERLLAVSDGNLYHWNGIDPAWTIATAPLTSGAKVEFVKANNLVYMFDGVTIPQSWDGVSATTTANPAIPAGSTAAYVLNRLIVAGTAADPQFVHVSDVLDFTTFNVSNIFHVGKGGGGKIVKVLPYRNAEILVFLTTGVFTIIANGITPASDWVIREIDGADGCVSGNTVKSVGDEVYYMSPTGHVRRLIRDAQDTARGTAATPLSWRIKTFIDAQDKSRLGDAWAEVFDDSYYLSFVNSDATTNNEVWRYDIRQDAWYGPWTIGSKSMFVSNIEGAPNLYHSGFTQKVFRDLSGNSDDGTTITSIGTTRDYVFGARFVQKAWKDIEILADNSGDNSGTVTVRYAVDGRSFTDAGTFEVEDDSGTSLPLVLPYTLGGDPAGDVAGKFQIDCVAKRGRRIRFQVEHSEADQPLRIVHMMFSAWMHKYEGEVFN